MRTAGIPQYVPVRKMGSGGGPPPLGPSSEAVLSLPIAVRMLNDTRTTAGDHTCHLVAIVEFLTLEHRLATTPADGLRGDRCSFGLDCFLIMLRVITTLSSCAALRIHPLLRVSFVQWTVA